MERKVKFISISEEDAAQVKAILLTHAEMSDRSGIEAEELQGLATKNCPEEGEWIDDLKDHDKDMTDDTKNLQRIAEIFS
jgi:hypothetical protein